jgi:hypothetical protein
MGYSPPSFAFRGEISGQKIDRGVPVFRENCDDCMCPTHPESSTNVVTIAVGIHINPWRARTVEQDGAFAAPHESAIGPTATCVDVRS